MRCRRSRGRGRGGKNGSCGSGWSSGAPFVWFKSRWTELRTDCRFSLRTPGVDSLTPGQPARSSRFPAMTAAQKVCVIGAGSSGIAACQVLGARGISFDCFEKGSEVGGNWRYENDNGMSSAYHSLHINTSRGLMAYRTSRCRTTIRTTPTTSRSPATSTTTSTTSGCARRSASAPRYSVAPGDGGVGGHRRGRGRRAGDRRYRAVLVANGHHWDPRWPEPAFPGSEEFEGEQIHAHDYRSRRCCAASACSCWASATPRPTSRSRRRASRRDLPRDAPWRLRHAQVPERQADR